MMKLLTKSDVLCDLKRTEADLKWVENDDEDAFISINTDKAQIHLDHDLLDLIKSKGVVSSKGYATFFKDNQGNLYKGKSVNTVYADELVVLNNGRKVWLKSEIEHEGTDDEVFTFKKSAKKYGLHEVSVDLPIFYKLSGNGLGNVWVIGYESPVNHVTGERNPYWNM